MDPLFAVIVAAFLHNATPMKDCQPPFYRGCNMEQGTQRSDTNVPAIAAPKSEPEPEPEPEPEVDNETPSVGDHTCR